MKNRAVSEREDGDGNLTLTLSIRKNLFFKVLLKVFFIPGEKNIRLDEMGSWVWNKCDGRTSVEKMIRQMSEEFKISRKEAEVSLMQFLKSLSKKKLLGFAVNKNTR